tara:strand:- start:2346 stop:2795 length:450 start_codon:yes stop_codon:yes gene_type:complete
MFYEVLMEKRASRTGDPRMDARFARADRVLRGLSEEDVQDALYGSYLGNDGSDEAATRRSLRLKRGLAAAPLGAIVGLGVGGLLPGGYDRPLLNMGLGAAAGAALGVGSVHSGKDPYYTNRIKYVNKLRKKIDFLPQYERMYYEDTRGD